MDKGKGQLEDSEAWPGDWYCNDCGDLQFARNSTCRRCGAPSPSVAAQKGDWECRITQFLPTNLLEMHLAATAENRDQASDAMPISRCNFGLHVTIHFS
eukprot:5260167-Amphidinium_carterae.1